MTSIKSLPLTLVKNDEKLTSLQKTNLQTCARKTFHEVPFPESHGVMKSVNFSPVGNVLIATFASGITELRNFPEGRVLRTWQFSRAPATCVRFHPKQEDLAFISHADGAIRRFRLESNDDIDEIFVEEKYDVNAVDLSHSGNFLATASKNKRIRVYDAETKKIIAVFKSSLTDNRQRFHSTPVVAVCWFPDDDNLLASAGWDNTIRIWDTRNSSGSAMTFDGPNILSSDGIDICGNHLIAGGWDANNALTLWHLKERRKGHTVNVSNRKNHGDGEFLYCAKFWKSSIKNADGRYVIIGGSGTKNVEMVDLQNHSIVYSWPKYGAVTTLASKGSAIAWGGSFPTIGLAEYPESIRKKHNHKARSNNDVERSPDRS